MIPTLQAHPKLCGVLPLMFHLSPTRVYQLGCCMQQNARRPAETLCLVCLRIDQGSINNQTPTSGCAARHLRSTGIYLCTCSNCIKRCLLWQTHGMHRLPLQSISRTLPLARQPHRLILIISGTRTVKFGFSERSLCQLSLQSHL